MTARRIGGSSGMAAMAAEMGDAAPKLIDFLGDFVMEAARGEPGQEPAWQTCMAARTANWLRGGALINERLS